MVKTNVVEPSTKVVTLGSMKDVKAAPNAIVRTKPHLERSAILEKLDKDYPEYSHMYQSPTVTDWELQSKNQELVGDEHGFIIHHKGDPVVRIPREKWDEMKMQEAKNSEDAVRSLLRNENLVQTRNPKKPTS